MHINETGNRINEFLEASNEALLEAKTVAAYFRANPYWVRRNKTIPRFKAGNRWKYKKADVLAWVENQKKGV